MSAYVIVHVDVTDPDKYEQYKVKAAESVAAAGGRYLARGGDVEPLEGAPPPPRTVILEFPTMPAASAWYHGPGYAEARVIRNDAARFDMYIVDGVG
jgi:uncharacterized protein (DUF1330 family)